MIEKKRRDQGLDVVVDVEDHDHIKNVKQQHLHLMAPSHLLSQNKQHLLLMVSSHLTLPQNKSSLTWNFSKKNKTIEPIEPTKETKKCQNKKSFQSKETNMRTSSCTI